MVSVPVLWPSTRTPANEVSAIKELYAQLCGVAFNVEAWAAALRLYQFCKAGPPGVSRADARHWSFVATNECAHQLHHLRERLQNISGYFIRPCPSLSTHVDFAQVRTAKKKLDEYFPDIDMLRNAIAHAGDNESTPKGQAPEEVFALNGFKEPDRFSASYEGSWPFLDITPQSLEQIRDVATLFVGAFYAAAKALEEEGHIE